MTVSIALFTADLRVFDNPMLCAAVRGTDEVVPLFVRDPEVDAAGFAAPNRMAFLADCLAALDAALRERGGRLIVRSGDVVREVLDVAAATDASVVHMSSGVTGFARRRARRLRDALGAEQRTLIEHDEVITVIAPGAITPQGSDHFAVFTPYYRRWCDSPLRAVLRPPRSVRVPTVVRSEALPDRTLVTGVSPGLARGGEEQARRRLSGWLQRGITAYEDTHDDLAGDATSRLSPYLHFGALSPVEAVHRASQDGSAGAQAFVRQLAWRDFHHQVLAARPQAAHDDYQPRGDRWQATPEEVQAWREGRTGYPIVDAAMRQLAHEGWMHNRGRLLAASFLTKTLYADWRLGAAHFLDLLVDGDIANNQLNWQWVAGTGTDTRPNRVLNPLTQAQRHDPDGEYVRRWVPELADIPGAAIHQPWRLPGLERARYDYPDPLVDLGEGRLRFLNGRGK
ncbi:deoxyribodipyrimidine photo-lyase [Streptomyces sp. NPDC051940]|uniref:cryptochrome/photolyase family protein n=1 Tax=Streptomyces sp. NPDC051940 TaxID=3155675 RepID=UPI00342567E6